MTTFPEQASFEIDAETVDAAANSAENTATIQLFDEMDTVQTALYERIKAFAIDEVEDSFSFSQRLARDNGWPLEFALRVVEEYKRFAFLAVAADHPVTPCDPVDQAWHLHLAYSRSYWEDFCPNALKTSLHHEPTRGGEKEGAKFENWYERTLASYERFFGEAAPDDIWPTVRVRFGRDGEFVRVNAQQVWVIPKLPVSREVVGGAVAVLVVGWFYFLQHGTHSVNTVGAILTGGLGAIASYSVVQSVAGFLDVLSRPKGVGGCATGSGCGGCGYGCGGCGC